MRRHVKSNFITFADGYGTSYTESERSLTSVLQKEIHYQWATVGERRYWDAKVSGTTLSSAVFVPLESIVNRGNIFVIDGTQYQVSQKDLKTVGLTTCWMLSLADAPFIYTDKTS